MDNTYILIAVVVILLVMGAILAPRFAARKRAERLHEQFGPEYDRTVETVGSEKQAQKELDLRQKRVEALNIRPLTVDERQRYQADWTAVQAQFVDQPGAAIVKADHLIMEVMQLREYPVSNFEERAADLSVKYPALVSDYRAARAIEVKNEKQQANTEELRQAMIHYRSLFKELVGTEKVAKLEKKA